MDDIKRFKNGVSSEVILEEYVVKALEIKRPEMLMHLTNRWALFAEICDINKHLFLYSLCLRLMEERDA